MCGIAGIVAASPGDRRPIAEHMAAALQHRGPDDSGCWGDASLGIAIAHRRLAILDLSPAGHQPMVSASGRYVIAFNGEIYNHLELRRELEESRPVSPWCSHSDTETLLAAIEAWGLESSLQRASGMLAFALVDRQERQLHLARDRFGEKPLYYGFHNGAFRFGSELSAFVADTQFPCQLDPTALDQLLRLSYVPAPRCIYAGVFKLPPGHRLKLSLGNGPLQELPAPIAWWHFRSIFEQGLLNPFHSSAEALSALTTSLQAAIMRQSLADVPLGCFLSGGIDSSLLAALMQQQSRKAVCTFTIGFEDAALDEAPHAEAVARELGTDHTTTICTEADALALVPQLAALHAEPFADPSQIPTHLLCTKARLSPMKVCLSGDGGDELFGGYSRYQELAALWNRWHRIPGQGRRMISASSRLVGQAVANVSKGSLERKVSRAAGQLEALNQSLFHLQQAHTSWWGASTTLLNHPSDLHPGDADLWWQERAHLAEIQSDARSVLMAADATGYLPDDLLVKVDRAAMAVGLETRTPFLDPAVADVALRCPAAMHFSDGQGKWLLRQLLAKHVPGAITSRPKAGFSPPLGAWLRGPLRDWASHLLDPTRLRRQQLVRSMPIERCWQSHLQGASDQSTRLWPVLMLQSWIDEWIPIDRNPTSTIAAHNFFNRT
jgi:asparagine synthase (glutamine-hydrolysing)